MDIRRYQLNKGIRAAVIAFLLAFLIGWLPAEGVYAQELGVDLPYNQSWENNSGRNVDNTFRYLLEADDGKSSLPAEGGDIEFTGKVSGNLHRTFNFDRPGYYHYKVTPRTVKNDAHYICDTTEYYLTFMVVNGEVGLTISSITIRDSKDAKYPALEYKNGYYVEPPAPTEPTETTQPTGQNGGRTAAQPGQAAINPVQVPPLEELPPQEEGIDGNDIPLHHGENDYWARLNLILMILTVLTCLVDIGLYFRREDEDKEDIDIPKRRRRKLLIRVATIVPAVIAVIMFILTEDMRLPMQWIDEWTIWMVVWLILAVILAFASRTKKDGDASDTG